MPLSPGALKSLLEARWIVPEGGAFPGDAQESADRFAEAVATWFQAALAMGFPCATAQARKSQLAAQATAALSVGSPPAAGQLLAAAVASYYAGQSFGTGVASFPLGLPAGASLLAATFSDLESPRGKRAQDVATACQLMALSTLVVFAAPPGSAPIT
jgi:hypothetical protein